MISQATDLQDAQDLTEEIDNGENPDAVKLAQGIKDGQSAQIKTMKTLFARL